MAKGYYVICPVHGTPMIKGVSAKFKSVPIPKGRADRRSGCPICKKIQAKEEREMVIRETENG